jgi:hypothetical protein
MKRPVLPRLSQQDIEKCARLNDDLAVAGETIQRWNNASTGPLIRILGQTQAFLCELYNRAEVAVERAKNADQAEPRKKEVA